MDAKKAKTDATLKEMLAKIDSNQEKMDVWQKETTVYQEAKEACLENKEPTSVKVEPETVHEEVPKEETFRVLKKRHGERHLAISLRG
jgi:hypothetical protein